MARQDSSPLLQDVSGLKWEDVTSWGWTLVLGWGHLEDFCTLMFVGLGRAGWAWLGWLTRVPGVATRGGGL